MEVIGRRWTITYCFAGSLPGLLMMAVAHLAGHYATVLFVAGALITGFTVLSTFTAVRVYLSEQFPTAGNILASRSAPLCRCCSARKPSANSKQSPKESPNSPDRTIS